MRAMRHRGHGPAVLIGCATLIAAAGCGAANSPGGALLPYPSANQAAFLRGCTASVSAATGGRVSARGFTQVCSDSLACVERHIPLATFDTINRNILLGRSNPQISVLRDCEAAEASTIQRTIAGDAPAKELARTAQTTAETLATDQNGSYTGLNPAKLAQIEPTLASTPGLTLSARSNAGGTGYVVAVQTFATGDRFSILRHPDGSVGRDCSGLGCPGGRW